MEAHDWNDLTTFLFQILPEEKETDENGGIFANPSWNELGYTGINFGLGGDTFGRKRQSCSIFFFFFQPKN